MPAKKITVLGLGAMGARMAHRLLTHSYAVTVYNRTSERAAPLQERGAALASTPREAAEQGEVVIAMVRDDEASEAVWMTEGDGAVHGLRRGNVVIESSTLTPEWTRRLSEAVRARGAAFMEAPVVGTRPHAEAGSLTHLVGGEAETLYAVREVLDLLGGAVHHVGPVGTGAAMKLAVNALFAVQAAALAELLAVLRTNGIAETAAVEVLNAMPTASPAGQRVATLMTERAFAPNFPVELVAKDLAYADALAKASGVEGALVAAARERFAEAACRGYGGDDIAGVAQLYG